MIKASILVLTLAVFAFAAPQFQPEDIKGINQFVAGFLDTTGLKAKEEHVEECVSSFLELGNHDYLQGKPTTELDQAELVIRALDAMEVCTLAFEETYAILIREISQMMANRDLYFQNMMDSHTELLGFGAQFLSAFHERQFYKAGKKLGRIANILFGRHNEAIKAVRRETFRQIKAGTYGPDTNGVYAALDNATLFVEGFGNGFAIQNTAEGLYDAETGLIETINSTAQFVHDATHNPNINTLLTDLNNAWTGFSAFTVTGTQSADQVYTDFLPAIKLAETNATQVEVEFESNLKAAPLRSGYDLLAFKTDMSAGNFYGAGNAAGALSTIGLKGMDNVTSTN